MPICTDVSFVCIRASENLYSCADDHISRSVNVINILEKNLYIVLTYNRTDLVIYWNFGNCLTPCLFFTSRWRMKQICLFGLRVAT